MHDDTDTADESRLATTDEYGQPVPDDLVPAVYRDLETGYLYEFDEEHLRWTPYSPSGALDGTEMDSGVSVPTQVSPDAPTHVPDVLLGVVAPTPPPDEAERLGRYYEMGWKEGFDSGYRQALYDVRMNTRKLHSTPPDAPLPGQTTLDDFIEGLS